MASGEKVPFRRYGTVMPALELPKFFFRGNAALNPTAGEIVGDGTGFAREIQKYAPATVVRARTLQRVGKRPWRDADSSLAEGSRCTKHVIVAGEQNVLAGIVGE